METTEEEARNSTEPSQALIPEHDPDTTLINRTHRHASVTSNTPRNSIQTRLSINLTQNGIDVTNDASTPNTSLENIFLRGRYSGDSNAAQKCSNCSAPSAQMKDLVTINLRGTRFLIPWTTLSKRPLGRLARISENDANYDVINNEFYFDRNPSMFSSMLDFYGCDEMHLPTSACIRAFKNELDYWNLAPDCLAPCCWSRYRKAEEEERTLGRIQREMGEFGVGISEQDEKDLREGKLSRKKQLWVFMNEPHTSLYAKMWSGFIVFIIALSIVVLALESVLDMRQAPPEFWAQLPNITEKKLVFILENSDPHYILVYIEVFTLAVLTFELVSRFFTCDSKLEFCKSWFNVADIIGILPIWVIIVLFFTDTKFKGRQKGVIIFAYYFMMCLRLLRIFRLFKLVKHYKTLKILLLAIRASYRELLLLVILLSMGVIIYANVVYFVEVEYDNFMSIPEGLWWAIVTMTTVGYGDYFPKSALGCLVGSMCAVSGILVIALPVPVIANNFSNYYASALAWERMTSGDVVKRLDDMDECNATSECDPDKPKDQIETITSGV